MLGNSHSNSIASAPEPGAEIEATTRESGNPGHGLVVGTRESESASLTEDLEWRAEFIAASLCGAFALAGALLSNPVAKVSLFAAAYLAGSWFSALEVFELLGKRVLDVHFLMLLVAGGSAAIGAWGEGATLLFLFSFSGALERYAVGRTQKEIRSLFKTSPKTARLYESGAERIVPVDSIQPGMRLMLKPGDLVPVDCEVLKGNTACDESTLTGEAVPVEKGPADTLFSGTLNLWGAIEARALRPAAQSALSRVIEMIREAQHLKAPAQRFTDRFGTYYTYSILSVTGIMFLIWWLYYDLPPLKSSGENTALYRSMVLLVVASPCALVLSIPSAILSAIAYGARRGILFRGGSAVERLGDVNVVVMDKTGTVTTGDLHVEKIESSPPGRELEIATLAYSLENFSTHPLARAIVTHGKKSSLIALPVRGFESVAGSGVRGVIDDQVTRLGKSDWVREGVSSGAKTPGFSEVWLSRGDLTGVLLLRDDVRPQAREMVKRLHDFKIRTILLTGDRQETAELIREIVGIQEVKGGLRPEDKLRSITSIKRRGDKVAMLGDGVNDAPSLAAADVGVAMGARGSDAALEQADVVLMNDRLENFLVALELSRRARRVIRQNLLVSLGTVALLVTCALIGTIPLTVGVVGHEGSTVIVVLNSLRLLLK
jgi:Cd2+/Zn2+-exporting ATPase